MLPLPRHIVTCAIALASAGALAQAQPPSAQVPPAPDTNTVGNPQLRDFELPGTRSVPPPAQETAPPPPPPQVEPEPAPQPRPPVAAQSQPQSRVAERPSPRPVPTREAAEPATEIEQETPAATVPPVAEAPVQTIPIAPPVLPQAGPAPAPAPAAEEGKFPWLYLLFAGLLGLLAILGFRKFRARGEEVEAPVAAAPLATQEPAPVPAAAKPMPVKPAAPAPAPAPAAAAPSGIVGIQIRPWLELEFRPDRAAATLTDASVQYELIIRNKGNAPARNIRIEARMFNAGADQEREIGAFFAEPVRSPPVLESLPVQGQVPLRSAVKMRKEEVREIDVQGRRLFIPMVAFNVIYEWGNGRIGQTSTSYLVGREAETPSQKMGAFRMDLGPRLYRSVGQRQTALARIV